MELQSVQIIRQGSSHQSPSLPSQLPSKHHRKVLISNLKSTITEEEVQELFEAVVGPCVSANLFFEASGVSFGCAQIIAQSPAQAEKAVELLHQRLFDGIPLCVELASSHSNSEPSKSNSIRVVKSIKKKGRPVKFINTSAKVKKHFFKKKGNADMIPSKEELDKELEQLAVQRKKNMEKKSKNLNYSDSSESHLVMAIDDEDKFQAKDDNISLEDLDKELEIMQRERKDSSQKKRTQIVF